MTVAVSTMAPVEKPFVHPALSWSDADLVAVIPPHWLQFEPATKAFYTITGLVISVIGCVAFLGNAIVVYNYHISKRGGSRSNDLVVNLAFCDMMMAAIVPPMCSVSSFHSKWVFGVVGCQFHGFAGSLCGTAAIMTIAAMAIDRCAVIWVDSGRLHDYVPCNPPHHVVDLSLVWAVIPLLPGFPSYVPAGYLVTCSFNVLDESLANRIYIGLMCIGAFFLPLLIIGVAYGRIVSVIMLQATLLRTLSTDTSGPRLMAERAGKTQQIKSAKVSVFILMGWLMAWTPYCVVALMGIFGAKEYLTPLAYHLPSIFAKTAAVYNPIIYAFGNSRYRQSVKTNLRRCWRGDGHHARNMLTHSSTEHDHETVPANRRINFLTPTGSSASGVTPRMKDMRGISSTEESSTVL